MAAVPLAVVLFVACLTSAPARGEASSAAAIGEAPSAGGAFRSVGPRRLLDTRSGGGARRGLGAAQQSVTVQVAGRGGVPATGAAAVVLDRTALDATRSGSVTVFAAGRVRPATPNVSFAAGRAISNLVTVPLGAGGKVTVYNASPAPVHVTADVQAYLLAGTPAVAGAFRSVGPRRLLDTRSG